MKKLMILFSIIFFSFTFSCGKGNPTLPPSDPCTYVTPPQVWILYPDSHTYHPSVFLEIYVLCEGCNSIQVLDGDSVIQEVPNGFNSFNGEEPQRPTRIFVKRNSENLRLRAVKEGCYFDKNHEGKPLVLNYKLGTPEDRPYVQRAVSRVWSVFVKRGSWHQAIDEAISWWNKPEWNEGVVEILKGGSGFPINIYIYPREENFCHGAGCAALLPDRCEVWLEDPDGLDPMAIIHEFGHCIMVPGQHSTDPTSFMSESGAYDVYFPPEEKYWFVRKNS